MDKVILLPWDWIFGVAVVCMIAALCVYKVGIKIIREDLFELSYREFCVLMELEERGYQWICRNYNGELHAYVRRPKRLKRKRFAFVWGNTNSHKGTDAMTRIKKDFFFQVSRFDQKPHNINEMIGKWERVYD